MRTIAMMVGAALLCALSSGAAAADPQPKYDVDVAIENDLGRDLADLPVLIQVFRVFGRGVDYAQFNPKGFHVYDQAGKELPWSLRPVPPDFSLANDELVIVLPRLAKGAKLRLRVTNTAAASGKRVPYDAAALLSNRNNLVPNGGMEKGAAGWAGGKVVQDVVHSGTKALMLEAPGSGGKASAKCTRTIAFTKGRNYYFGFWGKCSNVTRRTWRYSQPWAKTPISGRVSFTGDPLVFPEFADKNHLARLMDNRDWYCYEANALSTLCTPQPALNTVESTLTVELNQENMPYLGANKPARVWIDDVLLVEQPKVEINWDRISKKLTPGGFFLYRRAATCLNAGQFPVAVLDPPRPYERIARITDAAVRGERKTITLGIHTPKPITGLSLQIGDLKGPGGATLGKAQREVEFNYTPTKDFKRTDTSLEGWVIDGNVPRAIDRPGYVDYLIGYRIGADATPGTYRGVITVTGGGKDLGKVAVELEVADYPLKVITDRFAGLIWNESSTPPGAKFLRYYSRCNFPYLMMFCRFLPFKGATDEVDIPKLLEQVKAVRDQAGCTAGVGLYWDVSLDKQGNKSGPFGGRGLWTRCGRDPAKYRARVKEMDSALAKAKLPPLVYMIWDEPRFCDPAKFGILKGTGALTTSDINFRECCESLQKGLFTHASVDTPGCDYGPMMRTFAAKCGQKVGFDSFASAFFHRYQTSFILSWGAATASYWKVGTYLKYHPHHKAYVRGANLVGLGEGMVDFIYFATLQDAIARAKKAGAAKRQVAAAEKDIKEVLGFCTDDYHLMSEVEGFTYNGGPERWGDDWFYDRWRTRMRQHTAAILKALGRRAE